MKRSTRIPSILIATLLLATPLLAEAPASDNSTARYEVTFLQSMIDHHAMAVETAELCMARAIHEDLRSMCEQIAATQSQEIEMMQSWLQDWYGITYEPQMTKQEMREMEHLASLYGAEFEIAFMEMMIRHHMGAIREASKCVDRVEHEELRTLCENIITTQAAEIEQMRTWLCEWYGECR
jgi:uncharacterized protein (DUF305 family)